VRKKEPGVSLATVYNTLGTLVRKGLIKILEFESLDNRYETNLALHINLICTCCGKIQDLQENIPISPEEVKKRAGFDVLDYRMEYYGLCEKCGDKSREASLRGSRFKVNRDSP
jgi:Fe2+ or Zn2+ uptake regulation protein